MLCCYAKFSKHPLCDISPSTPDLSAEELPDDITNDMADIPNDLELNQEDFSDVLPRLPDDLQDFDLFEGLLDVYFFKSCTTICFIRTTTEYEMCHPNCRSCVYE